MPDPRWMILNASRKQLVARLADRGVQRVEFVSSFGTSDESVDVWLGTATDEERDALDGPDPCLAEVRDVLAAEGYPPDQLSNVRSTVQSQETVDRDYDSSWFYALR